MARVIRTSSSSNYKKGGGWRQRTPCEIKHAAGVSITSEDTTFNRPPPWSSRRHQQVRAAKCACVCDYAATPAMCRRSADIFCECTTRAARERCSGALVPSRVCRCMLCRVVHAVCRRPVLVHGGGQRLHRLSCGQVRQHTGLVGVDVHSRVRRGVRVPGGIYVGEPSCRHVCVGSVCGGRGGVVQ